MTNQPAHAIIQKLVETFEQNIDSYHSTKKNETELRREFLDKFFTALGWDVVNEKGYDEAGKEVVHEFSVEVAGQGKKADYAFRVGRGDKFDFLVEAKKPSVKVENSQEAAFQLRRYGWSAKLPINILTDFEHFAVYDCRSKPSIDDKASVGRIMLIHYKEYVQRWNEIVEIFSPEAVRKGSFARYAEGTKGKKGTADIDDAFLEEIERWRDLLARNIAFRNKNIDIAGLNYAVQMTIDRIVFLRICEEREIEPENQLLDIANKNGAYKELCELFKRANLKYNSGLFHFKSEKGQNSHPDDLTLTLELDDKVLKDIISNLYYPKSPYAFLYIPSDILGQVYERFLGKVIRLTAGHQAKVEEKPEVRKAGGVYYTPTYIVDYIVKNTVGKLVENKSPKQVSSLKIVDPACGSGTFLLGAYQFLLDWHLNWYADAENEPKKWEKQKAIVKVGDGYRLTTAKKKEILLNNIHGVDIDAQAVEVTKLSLLLKVLENASGQLGLGMERVLPDLGNNIKCGNSLIGWDYFEGQMFTDEEERVKVNLFEWKSEFKDVFAQGGFDAVIGNPPYIRIQALQEWAPGQVEYYRRRYESGSKGNYDIYVVFVEKGLSLLNPNGKLGFILPSKFFATDYGENLRDLISKNQSLEKIVDFGHLQIFEQATTYTCLLFLFGSYLQTFEYAKVVDANDLANSEFRAIPNNLSKQPWLFSDDISRSLLKKIAACSKPLGELPSRIGRGSSSGADTIFALRKNGGDYVTSDGETVDIEPEILRTPIYATDFGRYEFRPAGNDVIIFPYMVDSNGYKLISETELKKKFLKTHKYLSSRKKGLELRKQFKEWYSFSAPRNLDVHETAQFLVPLLADKGLYCRLSADSSSYCLMASGGFSITLSQECKLMPEYVLGLLNSKLLFWQLRTISNIFRGGWITCTKQYVETLPIRTIDFANFIEKAQHDKVVTLVEQMLALHKNSASVTTPQEKERLKRQIEATDNAIDKLVYDLYGLNEEEIKIIEGAS